MSGERERLSNGRGTLSADLPSRPTFGAWPSIPSSASACQADSLAAMRRLSLLSLLGLLVVAVILTAAPGATAGPGTTWEYAVALEYPELDNAYWARPAAKPTPDLEAALAAAQAHWGAPPACGRPVVRFIRDWPTAGVAWPHLCLIDINPTFGGRDFDSLCELVTHEVGHLHGLGHGNPGDPLYDPALEGTVMDYRTDDQEGMVPACDRERRRRARLERRLFHLHGKASARRARCRRRHGHGRRDGRECRLAVRTSARLRGLRDRVDWPVW
jgi:hypothetical protein